MFTSEGYAHTGLRNVLGGLPRAALADSLCPGLTSGCAFGAKNENEIAIETPEYPE